MKLCIVGSGVVGQATGKGFSKHGHDVTFLDIDSDKITQLNETGLTAFHPDDYDSIATDMTLFSPSTPTVGNAVVLDHLLASI